MRLINIDLSQDKNYPQNIFGGYAGEHKESKLVVSLPPRLITDDISYYYFEFQTAYGEHLSSPSIYKSELVDKNKISIELWEQLVPTEGLLKFCVTAATVSSENEILIKGKTALINLQILKSPSGDDVLINPDGTKEELQKAIDGCIDDAQKRGKLVGSKTPDNGEIFSTYSGDTANKALGKACSAFGENNIAGCYGFKVIGFVKGSGSTNAKVTLNTDDTHFDNIVVGDLVSVRINYNKDGLSVVAVDKTTKTVTVSNSLEGFPNYKASDNDYLWLVEKPLAGDTSIGIGAFAGGFSGNHANQDGSLAFGRNNIADGRWSVALGTGNKAGYNTFVYGKDNLALLGEVTAVIGQNNKFDTYTSKSLIIGHGNTTTGGYTIDTIVNGRNNTTLSANNCLLSGSGLKSTRHHQTIIGLYNELSNAMFIVGKGNSDTIRVNAFEVYEDGHAEVQTQGTTDDSVVQYSKNSLNGLLNKLDAGTSTPQDGDYFISQYVGGGTTNKTYCRRPVSALYNYIKGKADTTVTASSTNLVTSKAVDTAINNKITSVYKAKGSIPSISDLPVPSKDTESFVYNIESGFTTTDKFVEGVGKTYPAGTNVVIINVSGSTYQYDVLAGMVDLSNYATKTDLSGKLDKVTTVYTDKLYRVYTITDNGVQTMSKMSSDPFEGSLAVRTATGTLRAKTPVGSDDLTTKKYVDDIVGDINTILSTLVTVTSTQSDEPVSDENVLNDETTVSEEPTI